MIDDQNLDLGWCFIYIVDLDLFSMLK